MHRISTDIYFRNSHFSACICVLVCYGSPMHVAHVKGENRLTQAHNPACDVLLPYALAESLRHTPYTLPCTSVTRIYTGKNVVLHRGTVSGESRRSTHTVLPCVTAHFNLIAANVATMPQSNAVEPCGQDGVKMSARISER